MVLWPGCLAKCSLIGALIVTSHLIFLSFRVYSAAALLCSQYVVIHLQAVARPKFRGPRSASVAWSQVWLGLPIGRFQSGGTKVSIKQVENKS